MKLDTYSVSCLRLASSASDGSDIVHPVFMRGEEAKPGTETISARTEEIGDNEGLLEALINGAASRITFNTTLPCRGAQPSQPVELGCAGDNQSIQSGRHSFNGLREFPPSRHAAVRPMVSKYAESANLLAKLKSKLLIITSVDAGLVK